MREVDRVLRVPAGLIVPVIAQHEEVIRRTQAACDLPHKIIGVQIGRAVLRSAMGILVRHFVGAGNVHDEGVDLWVVEPLAGLGEGKFVALKQRDAKRFVVQMIDKRIWIQAVQSVIGGNDQPQAHGGKRTRPRRAARSDRREILQGRSRGRGASFENALDARKRRFRSTSALASIQR